MHLRRATKMRVVTVDCNGKELGDARWVDIPKPDSFRSKGFARIYQLREEDGLNFTYQEHHDAV